MCKPIFDYKLVGSTSIDEDKHNKHSFKLRFLYKRIHKDCYHLTNDNQ